MIVATALKTGTTFEMDGKAFRVIKYSHIKIGRGGASVRVNLRDLTSGALTDITFPSTAKFNEIATGKKPLQYLYSDGQNSVFMDTNSFEQIEIPKEIVGEEISYLKEGENVDVMFWGDKPIKLELAPKVVLIVKDTTPGVKGNSVSNMYKPATLENGLEVRVPLFIKIGDKIRVDTRNGDYVERA
jgi:elongation factor P